MIDHVVLNVRDLAESQRFYEAALEPLGYRAAVQFEEMVGFAAGGSPDFWIVRRDPVGAPVHVALRADSRSVVDGFHGAALAVGGTDHGRPGPRPEYHASYYGAFVLDPDGNNIEAVCHAAEGSGGASD